MSEEVKIYEIGQKVSANCVLTGKVTSLTQLEQMANDHKAVFTQRFKVKAAAVAMGMPYRLIKSLIENGEVWTVNKVEKPKKERKARKAPVRKIKPVKEIIAQEEGNMSQEAVESTMGPIADQPPVPDVPETPKQDEQKAPEAPQQNSGDTEEPTDEQLANIEKNPPADLNESGESSESDDYFADE